jgi:hypothetical protein
MSISHPGYGSEWHLLRFLGRHREHLTAQALMTTGGSALEWCDFQFTGSISKSQGDAELKGVDFLPKSHSAHAAWASWWPTSGNVQNWDAVGRHTYGDGEVEWLLVEAKGNIGELKNSSDAKPATEGGGRNQIELRMADTQAAMGVVGVAPGSWLIDDYQYANRLAMLHFLTTQGIPARLLFIYFTGDASPGKNCPAHTTDWHSVLSAQKTRLGLTGTSTLETKIHELFLPVA